MDLTPYIGPVVTALVFVVGSYVAMKNANNEKFNTLSVQIATLTTQVSDLKAETEKHNRVIERTYKLETDVKTAFKRIDELKEADLRIQQQINR